MLLLLVICACILLLLAAALLQKRAEKTFLAYVRRDMITFKSKVQDKSIANYQAYEKELQKPIQDTGNLFAEEEKEVLQMCTYIIR
jgi:Skp family chaperone for outer membrane proteins